MLDYIWIRLYLKPIIARIQSDTCTGIHIIFATAQLLRCSAWRGSRAHEHVQSRRTARWPHYCATELQTWPASLTTRQICTEDNPELPFPLPGPSPCSPSQHFRRLWEEVRPIKSSSSVYELHIKQIDAVFLPTPCILSPLTSSWRCAFDHLPRFPLFSYWGVSAHLQGLSHPPRDTILSACHRSYFWVPRSINMPRTLGRGGLIVPLPIYLLSIHPTAACSHLASSLQHPKPSRWINWG